MSNYVSKEELEEFFEGITITVAGRTRAEAVRDVLKAVYNGVMELPTTDALPVIRCKDCKRDGTDSCSMAYLDNDFGGVFSWNKPDEWCSRAERKEE